MAPSENSALPADLIAATARELGITMTATFIPWSQSRNKDEKHPSLNWLVTLQCNGRSFLTTDYMQGSAHCPSYKATVRLLGGPNSLLRAEAIKFECENGKAAHPMQGLDFIATGKPIVPKMVDVLACLALDASVLNASGFEDWASEYGYEPDSRKAEAVYQACLATALKMRAALGDEGLRKLQTAAEGY